MRDCPCPVWIVDSEQTKHCDAILAAVNPQSCDPEHIALNHRILDIAADLAEAEEGELHIGHVWRPVNVTLFRSRMPPDKLNAYIEADRRDAERRLTDLLSQFEKRTSPHGVHLLRGEPEQAISEFVARRGIDIIVIGTAGRKGVGALLLGSTAEKVLRRVGCSILAVKPGALTPPIGKTARSSHSGVAESMMSTVN